ncbi:MAG: hypothetical protein J7496_08650 [Novosphingobium sp.]|nr:hypothetical protein [Novosphingobium sp.]
MPDANRARETLDDPTFDLGGFCRALLLRCIENETDPAERKARIMILRQDGHLSDAEAADWIRIYGLEAA